MIANTKSENAEFLTQEILWLTQLIDRRLQMHAEGQEDAAILTDLPPPNVDGNSGSYADFLREHGCTGQDRLFLILALAPIVSPQTLDPFLIINQAINRRFTEFGGRIQGDAGLFAPTLQTAIFILAGQQVSQVLKYLEAYSDSPLHGAVDAFLPDSDLEDHLALGQRLILTQEMREFLLWGNEYLPPFSTEFPAEQLTTAFEWDDLVLPEDVREEIEQISNWVQHQHLLMDEWGLSKRLAAGYRALFSGPPGTGKSLTAALLGKRTERTVFRVDLSKIVSKYIGETEKNLARLFDRAQSRDWILFFDEADSLFGRRGDTDSAGDRAANQNVSYLLQRIESFEGTIILASNLPDNIDDAFARRFQSIVNFRMPDAEERLRLWKDSFEDQHFAVSDEVDWLLISRNYDVSGGQITNILRFCCMRAANKEVPEISNEDVLLGIRREHMKQSGAF